MTFTIVSSGTTASNVVLNSGDIQQITSSGTTVNTVVLSGGTQNVYGNGGVPGEASATAVSSGGVQDVSAGRADFTIVTAGGLQIVENNGRAVADTVSGAGALVSVSAGGATTSVGLSSGGEEILGSGGTASSTTVGSGGLLDVASGYSYGALVSAAGSAVVSAGGNIGATVYEGGIAIAMAGGYDSGIVVSSGGEELVSGGYASATTISNGGAEIVFSGGVTSGVSVQAGGIQVVSSSANASATGVGNGGVQVVSAGGVATSGVVANGGIENVLSGGTANSATVQTGGVANISSGGGAALSIVNGGAENVLSGGSTNTTRILAGAENVSFGAVATGAILSAGALNDAGIANATLVRAGTLTVSSGGVASGTYIFGGAQSILAGGVGSSTGANGGTETIFAGGLETGASFTAGAMQIVSGMANGTTLVGGGRQYVAGGQTSGTTVNSGGTETIQFGGVATGTTVNTSGLEIVSSGGSASGGRINTGGSENVLSGAIVGAATVSGGTQTILAGGYVNATLLAGAAVQTVSGIAAATTISSGAVQIVYGSATSTTVLTGGIETVRAGTASATTVSSGGQLTVSGGSTVGATIGASGSETVLAGGSASASTINSGGTLYASGTGALASGTIISGGLVTAISGGTLSAGTLLSGAVQRILSGGVAADSILSGGTEFVSSGGMDLRAVVGSGGTLNVNSLGTASAATIASGGTEVVFGAGTAIANILTSGVQTVSSAGVASATVVSAGGIQQVAAGGLATATFVSALGLQSIGSGGVASAATVVSGGSQVVSAGGSAGATTVTSGGMQTVIAGGTATNTLLSGAGSLVNHGTTSATSGTAVTGNGGSASIYNDGTIVGTGVGGVGISISGGTVENAGNITGLGGTAIKFGGTTTNRLIVDSGSVISGVVSATSNASNTLELSGAPAAATLSGYTSGYLGFQTVQVDSGSSWDIAGTNAIGALNNGGILVVGASDHLKVGGAVATSGTGGTIQVTGRGVLELDGATDAGETLAMGGTTAEVILADPADFHGTITGLARGDVIDLSSVAFSGTTGTLTGNLITVQNGGASYTLTLGAAVTGSALRLVADANNQTELLLVPPVMEALANDTGFSASDRLTSVAGLTGTADPNSTVRFTEGTIQLGSTSTDASGAWSFTPTLADGVHTVVASETDAGGNTGLTSLSFTLDTQASAPPILTLAAASDSNIVGDDVTNVSTPTLGGSGTTGDLVTLYDGSTAIGSATITGGTWTLPLGTALTDGTHPLTAKETDPTGNVSSPSTTLSLVIDTVAPAAPIPSLAASSDSGVAGDGITNDTTPSITGTGGPGDTVTLYSSGVAVGTATVAGNGTFSVAPSAALTDGTYSFTVRDADTAGNSSPISAPVSVTIDTAMPGPTSAPSLDPASDTGVVGDGITSATRPSITGTGTPGDTITLYDGQTAVGTATVSASGSFSVAPSGPLSDGPHALTVSQADFNGSSSTRSSALNVTVESTTPSAPMLSLAAASDSGVPGDNLTNVVQPSITGTGSAGDTITLYSNGVAVGTGIVAGNGTFSVAPAPALGSGTYSFTATDANPAGNVSAVSAPLAVTIDTAIPAPTSAPGLAPASDSGMPGDHTTNVVRPSVTGTGTTGDTVSLYDSGVLVGTATVGTDGTFSVTPAAALGNGEHSLTTTETSPAGNVSTVSGPLAVTIDTVLPPVTSGPVLSPSSDSGVAGDHVTSSTRPLITGNGVAGYIVTLYDLGTVVGTATVGQNGRFSVSPVMPLTEGAHTLTTTQTDPVGNTSLPSQVLNLVTDTLAPVAPLAALAPGSDSGLPGDRLTNVTRPVIAGTAEPGGTITLYSDGFAVGTTVVSSSGTYSVAPGSILENGFHSLAVGETDAAGNSSILSAPVGVTVDTTAPAAVSNLMLLPASDSGVPGDKLTNVVQPSFKGTGTAGDTITLYSDGAAVGSAVVGANGAFSVLPSAMLADGSHAISVIEIDPAGNVSGLSNQLAVTIDTAIPSATSAPALGASSDSGVLGDGNTNVAQPSITGIGTAGDVVTLFDAGTAVGIATVGLDGKFSVAPAAALSDGTHSFTTTQTSPAGNTSSMSTPLPVVVDTVLPPFTSYPALDPASDSGTVGDGITNNVRPSVTGMGVAGDTVTLYDAGVAIGTAIVAHDGTFSVAPIAALPDGAHSLTTTQTDQVGNVSAASQPLVVTTQTAAPPATIIGSSSTNGLTGTATPGDTVNLYSSGNLIASIPVGAGGVWTYQPSTLAAGPYSLTARVSDDAGNLSPASAALALTVARNQSYVTTGTDASGTTTTSSYNPANALLSSVSTATDGGVVTMNYASDGTIARAATYDATGLLKQQVSPTATIHEIYDIAGTLIGTVSGPGSTNGTPPQPGFDTTRLTVAATTTTDPSGSIVTLLSENNTLALTGSDTVNAAGGNATISASSASVLVHAGAGALTFYGGAGISTVTGGTGSASLTGGSGGGVFAGGSAGYNLLVAGGGNTTLFGAAAGDVFYGSASGSDVMFGGAGQEFLVGGGGSSLMVGGSGSSVMFGGPGQSLIYGGAAGGDAVVSGSGQTVVVAQHGDAVFAVAGQSTVYGSTSGNDTMVGGSGSALLVGGAGNTLFVGVAGQTTVFGGAGNDTVFTGAGTLTALLGAGSDQIALGSGSSTVFAGLGTDLFTAIAGYGGGNNVISDFKVGTDTIALSGYDLSSVQVQSSSGNTFINFVDGTKITLIGVTKLAANSVV